MGCTAGEEGIDWGGLFRDTLHRTVEDVFGPHFALLVRSPNGRNQRGTNTETYLPNPAHAGSPLAANMLEFLGRLMGASLRLKMCLPFAFPSIVRVDVGTGGSHGVVGSDLCRVAVAVGILRFGSTWLVNQSPLLTCTAWMRCWSTC